MIKYIAIFPLLKKISERENSLLEKSRRDTELGTDEWQKLWIQINELNWVKYTIQEAIKNAERTRDE